VLLSTLIIIENGPVFVLINLPYSSHNSQASVLLHKNHYYYHHHHQFNMHECSMNNTIHDGAHTIIQKDTKNG